VRRWLPFREAHGVVGRLVQFAEERGKTFAQLTLAEYRRFSPLFRADVESLTLATALAARDVPGGTAPRRVAAALRKWKRKLKT
jgi:argininosuccinate lyase